MEQEIYDAAARIADQLAVRFHPDMLRQYLAYRMAERKRCAVRSAPLRKPVGDSVIATWVRRYDYEFNHYHETEGVA